MANSFLRSAKWAPGIVIEAESTQGAKKWRVSSAAIIQLSNQAK